MGWRVACIVINDWFRPNKYMQLFLKTCRKRANASHGKNSSFKSQAINFFNLVVTITSKIIAHLIFILLSN